MKLNYGPREKLEELGVKNLSNSELLSILLNTGTRTESVKDLATRLIGDYGLHEIDTSMTAASLQKQYHLGRVKSLQLLSLLELSARLHSDHLPDNRLDDPTKIVALFPGLEQKSQEELRVVYLDTVKRSLSVKLIAKGTIDTILIPTNEILRQGLLLNAHSIVVVHNHPSGNSNPSDSDLQQTKKLAQGAKLVGLHLLDHLIVGKNYFSFYEQQLLPSI